MNILIIEDTIESAQLFMRILSYAGHNVLHTISGLEGLRLARRDKPDVILLDFNLPDIDGSQVCLTLRPQLPDTTMIAVTSQSDRATRKKAELFGFDAFIPKPVNIEELLQTVQSADVHHNDFNTTIHSV